MSSRQWHIRRLGPSDAAEACEIVRFFKGGQVRLDYMAGFLGEPLPPNRADGSCTFLGVPSGTQRGAASGRRGRNPGCSSGSGATSKEDHVAVAFRTQDWDRYQMDYHNPHKAVEPLDREIAVVGDALAALSRAGILLHTEYDHEKMLAHREAVKELFEIPWTAITPRMQRLLYAINAIVQPRNMIAAGVFCGNTFISNAGAAVGPGACYTADALIGVEINAKEAERAERNVRRLDPSGVARVLAADAVDVAAEFAEPIHLLYLDADGDAQRGKGIYLEILEAGLSRMPAGSVVLAHNSVNCADRLKDYLSFVRDPAHMRASVNVVFDPEGLEVSVT